MDGPSGTGKSTVARGVATRLGARYLDTGAMYRAATLAVLRAGVDPSDGVRVTEVVEQASIDVGTDPAAPAVRLDGSEVEHEIRSAEVTGAVQCRQRRAGRASAPRRRAARLDRRRPDRGRGTRHRLGRVADGAPKVFLTASAQVRAQRRAGELGDVGRRRRRGGGGHRAPRPPRQHPRGKPADPGRRRRRRRHHRAGYR